MAQPYTRTQSASGAGRPAVLDVMVAPFNVTLGVVLSAGATLTYSVEFTLDDPRSATDATGGGLTWFSHATLAGLTASNVGNLAFPVRAVRLNITSYTSGTAALSVLQAGN